MLIFAFAALYTKFLSRSITKWSARKASESGDIVIQSGYGIEFSRDGGHVIYAGHWEYDHRHGFGREYQDIPQKYYVGHWKAGQHNGQGRDFYEGKDNYYLGKFHQDIVPH